MTLRTGKMNDTRVDQDSTSVHLLRIQRFCLHDGPGIRTTVFLKGCPLRCRWCHNPESHESGPVLLFSRRLCTSCGACVDRCPHGAQQIVHGVHSVDHAKCTACGACVGVCMAEALAIHGGVVSVSEIMRQVVRDRDYYEASLGGVTVSGGEPLRQPEAAIAIADACHNEGVTVYLDTSGFAEAPVFDAVVRRFDGILFDLKLMDPTLHERYTGVRNEGILASFRSALRLVPDVRARLVLIPGLTDTRENIDALITFAKDADFTGPVDIMPYHRMGASKYEGLGLEYAMEDVEPPTAEEIQRLVLRLESSSLTTTVM